MIENNIEDQINTHLMFNTFEQPISYTAPTTAEGVRDLITAMVNNDRHETSKAQLAHVLVSIVDYFVNTPPGEGLAEVATDNTLTGDGTLDTPLSIATGGVTSTKLASDAVTASKIAANAVTETKINTGAVTNTKLGAGAVTNDKVGDGEIALAKLAQSGATTGQVPKWNGSAWAPAADNNSGGGGGSIPTLYDAGNGAYVIASDTGITYTKSAGVGTFSVPAGVYLYSARVHGTSSDLLANNIDVSFGGLGMQGNATLGALFPPMVMKYDRLLGGDPGSTPYPFDIDNTPQMQISGINDIKIRVVNLNGILNWGLLFKF